jgi:glycosyltransferase involved in cell wall biosynthesis
MKPLVSILIPAFNAERWISDTLRSALAQTWENKEIIVVDDGSTDRTIRIVQGFQQEGVRLYSQANQGAAAARNHAFSLSKGDYIQWLDADDLLAPDKIARQMEVLERSGSKHTLASGSWGRFMYRPHRTKFIPNALWCDLSPAEWLTRKMGLNLFMQTACWLVSRQVAEQAGPWDTTLLGDDDGEYFCRNILASDSIRFVPESKVYYRQSGASSLSFIGRSEKKMVAQWHSMELHIGYLLSLENSQKTREACITYLQNWLVYFYPDRPDLVELAKQKAVSLGGQLQLPRLTWKYSWINKLFGRRLAKRAQIMLPYLRWSVVMHWDKALSQVHLRHTGRHAARS